MALNRCPEERHGGLVNPQTTADCVISYYSYNLRALLVAPRMLEAQERQHFHVAGGFVQVHPKINMHFRYLGRLNESNL